MKIFPSEKYEMAISRKPIEILMLLKDNVSIQPKWSFLISSSTNPFYGKVADNDFRIYRKISYGNSFLPIIKGKIVPDGSGTLVKVNMGLHPIIRIFMTFWLSGVALFFAAVHISAAFSGETLDIMFTLIPPVMFILGVALMSIPFYIEAKIAKRLLSELLM